MKKEGQKSGITYTVVLTGPFFDWGIQAGFIFNVKGKSVDYVDGGERVFSATTLSGIATAVVGVLKHPKETENRAVYVAETATTLKKLVGYAKKAVGEEGWTENVVAAKTMQENAYAELKKEKPDFWAVFGGLIKGAIWGEGYGSHFEKLDNELLGVQEKSEDEIQEIINGIAASG